MTSLREYKKLLASLDYRGKVRIMDTSWSANGGWHSSSRELFFIGRPVTDEEIEHARQGIFDIWERACLRFGVPAPSQAAQAVCMHRATSAADYLAASNSPVYRWRPLGELTRDSSQPGREARLRPFDLLRARALGYRPRQMTALFHECAQAFHAKRQLFWSHGLKADFGIRDYSDKEAAEMANAGYQIAGRIGPEDWVRVTAHGNSFRVTLLENFERGGMPAVETFLARSPGACVHKLEVQTQ